MIDLGGRTALITGGSRGVGAAAALLFARAGADVAITYRTRQADAEAVAGQVRALGRRAFAAGGDLAERGTAARIVDNARAELGRLDFLVANAGIWPPEAVPLKDLSDARWRETMAANLDGVFETVRAALRVMDEGSIVLVSSTAGQRGEALHADYAATKGALISLTKSLAIECAPRITVNGVAPGWIETEMSNSAYADGGRERIAKSIPIGRVATAEDVAGPIVFLCSPLARHITGEILNVNGGSVLCG
ncbi:MAG TPA: SDR family oxidoreductase [Gemmatimonadales bacterium]|nr:SDR family oxidoreductase [Gemmatimonadales bacterium]